MSEIELKSSPGRRPLSDLNVSNDPLSPTANLKLLTKVASNFEKQHVGTTGQKSLAKSDLHIREQHNESTVSNGMPKSRKEKSLSLLCDRFLKLFPLDILPGDHMVICIDQAAKELGTERRRIYDIINVLESLEMASKVGKNRYMWYGTQQLPNTLAKLKGLALHLKLHEQIQSLRRHNSSSFRIITDCTGTTEVLLESNKGIRTHILYPPNQSSVGCLEMKDSTTKESSSAPECKRSFAALKTGDVGEASANVEAFADNTSCKEEKSLGVMCQKFMMLFLILHGTDALNLDLAAKILMSESSSEKNVNKSNERLECCHKNEGDDRPCQLPCSSATRKLKTKVRRLYDIANVLTSLGLICKIQNHENSIRKPAFRYTGPYVEPVIFMDEEYKFCQMSRHSLLRNSGPLYEAELKPSSSEEFFPDNDVDSGVVLESPNPKRRRKTSSASYSGECPEKQNFTSRKPLSRHNSSSSDSLTDILQVAEIELKRLKSLETPCPADKLTEKRTLGSARKKLFLSSKVDGCTTKSEPCKPDENIVSNSNVLRNCSVNGKGKNMIKVTRKLVKVLPTAVQQFQPSIESGSLPIKVPDNRGQMYTLGVPFFACASNVNNLTKDIAQNVNVPGGKKQWKILNVSSASSTITSTDIPRNHLVLNPYNSQPSAKKSSIFLSQNGIFHSNAVQCYVVPSHISTSVPVLGKVVDSSSIAGGDGASKAILSSGKIFSAVKVGGTMKLVPVCNSSAFISPSL